MNTHGDKQQGRYFRQSEMDGWGEEAQKRVADSTVLVAGAGGLGSPVSLYLAAAGVGTLILWDYDDVSLSNLNRQILYSTDDIGREKSSAAAAHLSRLNPEIELQAISTKISEESLARLAVNADLIVDCMDNMAARYLLNSFAVSRKIPLVHGGVQETNGQVMVVPAGGKPCLECLFGGADSSREVPVLGAAVGIIGSMEALEALKLLSGYGTPLAGRLLICEGFSARYQEIEISPDPGCPVCGG
ncbi:MAG: HesA/MoeB/ThiF family protein [Sediminispirochaetaceae bacterium]